MRYKLVIDQSTSATKLLLVEASDKLTILKRLDKSHQQIYPQKGYVEHDPKEIIDNIKDLIGQLLIEENLTSSDIESLSITNQRESIVVWNSKTGEPYGNVMVWQCNRGLTICEELMQVGHEKLIEEKTGLRLDPYFSASKLKWFFERCRLTDEEQHQLCMGTIDTWIIWNLTEGARYITEPSNACRTLLYNIETGCWDAELCQLFEVPLDRLPQVLPSDGDFGDYLGIPIRGVLADSQAALYAHSQAEAGAAKMTLGTGSSILLSVGQMRIKKQLKGLLQTIAWTKEGEAVYALEGLIKSYGDSLNWVRDQLRLFETYQQGADFAFSLKNNGGVYFLPALEGWTAPFWRANAQASFVGLTRDTNSNHMIRAVFEAMCYQVRSVLDLYEEQGYELKEIYSDGGSVKNSQFMQLLADITGKRLLVGKYEELSAIGALFISDSKVKKAETIVSIYEPKRSYENDYQLWLQYVCQSLQY